MKMWPSPSIGEQFKKGQRVEVLRTETNAGTVWFPALVLCSATVAQEDNVYVEFDASTMATCDGKPLREFVEVANIRPAPPQELHMFFKVGEMVEAFLKKGWRKGKILNVLENSRYAVLFCDTSGEDRVEEVEHRGLRAIKEWVDGCWVPPLQLQKNGTEPEFKSQGNKLLTKKAGNLLDQFSRGMMVEVRSNEAGYQGSWFTAVILGTMGSNKLLLEYQTLKTDDESEPLKETAYSSYVRPCPPKIEQIGRFQMLDEVDAWYNDGWWVGVISKILGGLRYAVYFWTSNEELEFSHHDLRLHQEWIGGKWIVAFRKKYKLLLKSKLQKLKRRNSGAAWGPTFCKGQQVEVKRYEDGCRAYWHPAIIFQPIENGKYLVQYENLINNDNCEPREADAQCIRPWPPVIGHTHPFKPLEEVDACYKGGWWVGHVCQVIGNMKYTVYLEESKEVLDFQHSKLRPHQDWVYEHWVPANGGWTSRPR